MSERINFFEYPNPESTKNEQENNELPEEKEKREKYEPRYKYYFHGSFLPAVESIEKDGFNFKDAIPNNTTSPLKAMNFPISEIRKGYDNLKTRMKHFKDGGIREEIAGKISKEDAVLFIIEPPEPYRSFLTNIGTPNKFSTAEQTPPDVEEKIYYRKGQWEGNQRYIAKNKFTDCLGPELNKKRTSDGRWEKVSEDEKIGRASKLAPDSIKMIINYSPEFLKIFEELRSKFANGISVQEKEYIDKIDEYFKKGEGILKDDIEEKYELEENMVRGEIEHYLVSKIRRIFLEIERLRGKNLVDVYNELGRDDAYSRVLESGKIMFQTK